MQILGLFGMYFDAVVVEVKTFLLLFRLTQPILWAITLVFTVGKFTKIYMFTKGQSISKGLLGVFKPTKKPNFITLNSP